jgi:hypothetical protein
MQTKDNFAERRVTWNENECKPEVDWRKTKKRVEIKYKERSILTG